MNSKEAPRITPRLLILGVAILALACTVPLTYKREAAMYTNVGSRGAYVVYCDRDELLRRTTCNRVSVRYGDKWDFFRGQDTYPIQPDRYGPN